MKRKLIIFSAITILIILIIFIVLNKQNTIFSEDKLKDYANELKNKGLYQQAIEAYEEYLNKHRVSKNLYANICYTIAEIYRQNLKDYDNALKYYIKIKYVDPEYKLMNNVNQYIVECLENSGRVREAELQLEETTLINREKQKVVASDQLVAKIDSEFITLQQFNDWYNRLPAEITKKFQGLEGKKKLFQQFISEELLYRMALRKGLQNDPKIIKNIDSIKRSLMLQELLNQELKGKINITENDLKLYYKANKEKYNNRPFSEVIQNVYNDLYQEKIREQSQILLEKLIKANRVEIYDGNIR